MMTEMSRAVKMLLEKGWITKEQYEQAMVLSTRYGETPGYHLVDAGAIDDEDLVDFFIRHFSLKYWPKYRLKSIPIETISTVTPELAKHLRVLPVQLRGRDLTLGLTDPSLTHVADEAAYHTRRTIHPVIVTETDMTWALSYYYGIHPTRPADRYSMKPPAYLERETHDLISAGRESIVDLNSAPRMVADVTVTTSGWDIDEWGIGDDADKSLKFPPKDDAVRLSIPRTKLADQPNEIPIPSTKIPFVTLPPDKATLPPAPMRQHIERPTIKHSIASMTQGVAPDAQAETDSDDDRDITKQSTSDIRVPRQIREEFQFPKPEEISSETVADIIGKIKSATERDQVVEYALEYLLLFAERAAFLTVKKDEIRGFDIKGDETNRTAIKSYWIPASADSTFGRTVTEQQIHLGPLGRSTTDAVFSAALGGRPRRVLVIPVVLQHRVVGLLYADNLRIDMPPWNLLERLADVVGAALLNILLDRIKR